MPAALRRRSGTVPTTRSGIRQGSLRRSRPLASLLTGVLVVVTVLVGARPALAHVKLTESEPANVSSVPAPVDEVRLTYSKAAQPVRDRFAVTGPDGAAVKPASIENDGDSKIVVRFDESLPEGRNRVKWAIRAGDSHVMTGTVAFTVTAASSSSTTAPSAAGAADTQPAEPSASETAAADSAASGSDASGTAAPDDAAPAEAGSDEAEMIDAQQLAGETSSGFGGIVAAVARWALFTALLVAVGGLIYLAGVHRGSVAEGRRFVFWVRRAAVVVVVASLLDWFAQVVMFGGLFSTTAWGDVFTSWFAFATLLRLGGAALVLRFTEMDFDAVGHGPARAPRGRSGAHDAGRARRAGGGVAVLERPVTRTVTRFVAASSPLAFVGAALLVASESFTGHTASTAPWPLVVVADAVHVVAAAVWVAGAWMLGATLTRRHRRDEPLDARAPALRFSVAATWALVAVAVSGVLLAWSILDGVGALWSSGFGRLLLAKLVVVAAAAGIGAYNHRVLLPLLDRDDDTDRRFVRTVTVEGVCFVIVLGFTALLVAASPV